MIWVHLLCKFIIPMLGIKLLLDNFNQAQYEKKNIIWKIILTSISDVNGYKLYYARVEDGEGNMCVCDTLNDLFSQQNMYYVSVITT